jgi:hypothetical protein
VSALLRVAGAVFPIVTTVLVLTRWTLVSDGFFWYLVLVGFGSGLLLRSWWAIILAPIVNLGTWVVPVIVQDKQLFGGDFTLVSGVFVLLALHVLIAIAAAVGVGAGKSIEMRIAPRIDQY